MSNDLLQRLEQKAKAYFPEQGSHGFDHTLRVKRLAVKIAGQENADLLVVEAAALLHDIAVEKEKIRGGTQCHATEGAEEAAKILEGVVGFPGEKIEKVKHCIAVHRASKKLPAETIEAKILQDADRLEVIGAIGIARAIYMAGRIRGPLYDPAEDVEKEYGGEFGGAINHLIKKGVKLLQPSSFNTKTAQQIAKERHGFVKQFVERFVSEWRGER